LRHKRLRQLVSQSSELRTPAPVPPLPSDIVREIAARPHYNYPPRFDRADVSVGLTSLSTTGRPNRFGPDLRLLRPGRGHWLLVGTGAAVTRLMDLHNDGMSDACRPGDRAHVRAHSMLVGLMNLDFGTDATDVYSDPDGAIRLLWTQDDRSVELVFPSIDEEAPHLYHSDRNNFGVEEQPSPEAALKWIIWVLDNVLPGHVCAA
jgi:hypothetical protein